MLMRYQMLRGRAIGWSHRGQLFPALLLLLLAAGAASGAEKSPSAVLSLDDGGFAAGDLAVSDKPGVIRWQACWLCRTI